MESIIPSALLTRRRPVRRALDGVLPRLGGSARCWRTDRMSTIVEPGSGRSRGEEAELAKHYGVTIAVCVPAPR